MTKLYELLRTARVRSVLLDGKRLVDLEALEDLEAVTATPPAPGTVVMRNAGPGRPRKSARLDAVSA